MRQQIESNRMESLQEIRNLLQQKNKLQEQAQVFQNQI
jgi:hypothetical protein